MSSPAVLTRRRSGRRSTSRWGLLATLAAVVGLAVGCSAGPGSEQDFIDILSRNDYLTEAQATCIAEAVFDRYGDDPDILGRLSGAGRDSGGGTQYDQLVSGENAIDGFDEFYAGVVNSCTPAGP